MHQVRFSEPVQVAEMIVPRCSLTFGVAPCTASLADGPPCYQQWGGCLSRATFNNDATIKWRFMKSAARGMELYEKVGDTVATDPLYMLESVSVSESRINVGSLRDGDAPLGITGGCTLTFNDQPFDDFVGDQNSALRTEVNNETGFWARWFERVPYYQNIKWRIYEGFWGQTLEEMNGRTYIMESAAGPDSSDQVTIQTVDPLRQTDAKRAMFPPEMDMELQNDLNATSTADLEIQIGTTGDLLVELGNTTTKYIVIRSEVIGYTSAVEVPDGDGVWVLGGVARGQLGTTASAHTARDAVKRVGYFELMDSWEITRYLLKFSPVLDEFVNVNGEWQAEASAYLQGYQFTRAVVKSTPVNNLVGELMRDSTFYIWWDAQLERIPLKAVRPELPTFTITDDDILRGSFNLRREPKERVSRIHFKFDKRDPTASNEAKNYAQGAARIAAEEESELAGAVVSSKTIFSEWMINRAVADEVTLRYLARFSRTPVYASLQVIGDEIKTGDIVQLEYRRQVDTQGFQIPRRWQVNSAKQVRFKEVTELELQQFIFQALRYMVWMADDAIPYMDYPAEERGEIINAGFWNDEDGRLPDGSTGWLWQ